MKQYLVLGALAVAMSGCLQERSAPIEYKGSHFFGRDAVYDRWGNELPKYSTDHPGYMPESQIDKYSGAAEYGVSAEVPGVSSSDLPPPTLSSSFDAPEAAETRPSTQGEIVIGDSSPVSTWEAEPFAKGQSREVAEATKEAGVDAALTSPQSDPLVGIASQPAVTASSEPTAAKEVASVNVKTNQPATAGTETAPRFIWPVHGKVVGAYGKEKGNGGDGIAISARAGEPIRAASDGVVVYADDAIEGYGNMTIIRHQGNWLSAYAHAKELVVKKGDNVVKGQLIGFVGQSGNATEPQLHFSLRKDKSPVDPEPLLSDD